MKTIIALLILFISPLVYASEAIEFDGEKYNVAWSKKVSGKKITEYLKKGETIKNWSSMITVNQYVNARKVKEVIVPYLNSVKPMLALKPDILRDTRGPDSNILIVLVLLAPDRSHYEFIVHRFVDGKGFSVASTFFSYYLPFEKNLDFTFVMKMKNRWITEISNLKIPRFKMEGSIEEDYETF